VFDRENREIIVSTFDPGQKILGLFGIRGQNILITGHNPIWKYNSKK
jgi:hypothetical protein